VLQKFNLGKILITISNVVLIPAQEAQKLLQISLINPSFVEFIPGRKLSKDGLLTVWMKGDTQQCADKTLNIIKGNLKSLNVPHYGVANTEGKIHKVCTVFAYRSPHIIGVIKWAEKFANYK